MNSLWFRAVSRPFYFLILLCFEFCEPFTVCQGYIAVHLTIVQSIRFAVFQVAEHREQVDGAAEAGKAPLARPIGANRVEPEKITKDTAVFFVHGGGWHAGSRAHYHELMQELNNRGWLTAATDYRLERVTGFDQLQDIREAYDRFVSWLKQRGLPLKIAVYGGSAGAHLASLMCFADPGECGEKCQLENDWVKPCKVMLQATPYDFLHWEGMMPQSGTQFIFLTCHPDANA